jgi:hypothetical protein
MNPVKAVNNLIKKLPPRNQEILRRRFGLNGQQRETLEEIGRSYNLTRERIRQIEAFSFLLLKQEEGVLQPSIRELKDLFEQYNRILTEQRLSEQFNPASHQPYIFFILHLHDDFFRFREDSNFRSYWTTDLETRKQAVKSVQTLISYLKKRNQPLPQEEVAKQAPLTFVEISKHLACNPFGEFGLCSWPEIKPRGVRDKAYLILKKEGRSMHFREITEKINQANFSDGRLALTQTVHNELIKDPRFVLEGRGIYGLRDN